VISSFNTVNKKFLLITRVVSARNRIVGRSIVNATVLEADAWNLADVLSGKYYLFIFKYNSKNGVNVDSKENNQSNTQRESREFYSRKISKECRENRIVHGDKYNKSAIKLIPKEKTFKSKIIINNYEKLEINSKSNSKSNSSKKNESSSNCNSSKKNESSSNCFLLFE